MVRHVDHTVGVPQVQQQLLADADFRASWDVELWLLQKCLPGMQPCQFIQPRLSSWEPVGNGTAWQHLQDRNAPTATAVSLSVSYMK